MGYTTTFEGHITIGEPLLAKTRERLNFLGEDSRDKPELTRHGAPSGYCQWELRPDPDNSELECLKWDGGEKFYDSFEWMQFIVEKVLTDYTCNGVIEAQGEELSDRWLLVVENSKVSQHQGLKAIHTYLSSQGKITNLPSPRAYQVINFIEDRYGESEEVGGHYDEAGNFYVRIPADTF